ncbi:MAG: response regulator [Cyanobacteria bacterium SID2]|nr:response regulator [Cyanobacteria bacterium SID2]MBP0003143.1 response regulator [Cyanobacteria bacterium SBC]
MSHSTPIPDTHCSSANRNRRASHKSKMSSAIEIISVSSQQHFSGKLEITASDRSWSLYYRLGRLVWVSGGVHPLRRWRRAISLVCPQLDLSRLSLRKTDLEPMWEYNVLRVLLERKQIDRESIQAVISHCAVEVLFDILQASQIEVLQSVEDTSQTLTESLTLLKVSEVLAQAQSQWNDWLEAGLSEKSPDAAPTICNARALKSRTSEKAYRRISVLANGRNTLRDLAVTLKQDVLRLAQSLLSYLKRKDIELVNVPDLGPVKPGKSSNLDDSDNSSVQSDTLLIACIDDSLQNCKILETIVKAEGYRFCYVTDPLQALPMLIERKPDVIFLDLMMPVVNGYEICAQIRRVSALQNVPVIVLTSQDGLVDRMRAKIVKASGFLSKPIDPEKVLQKIVSLRPATSNDC